MPLKLQELRTFISTFNTLPNGLFYLQGDYPWTDDSLGIVYADSEGDDLHIDHPEYVEAHDLNDVCETDILCQIVENALLQNPNVTMGQIIQAFNH